MSHSQERIDNMRDLIKEANFSFALPADIEEQVHTLEAAIENKVSWIDCIQDEIRNLAHCSADYDLTFEQSEEVIDFFCRKRWNV